MNRNRVIYLDGVRGMAALIVLFYHYLLGFYPAIFLFKPPYVHTGNHLEYDIGTSVFYILCNPGFAVCLFFVLSGYALSYKYFETKSREYLRSSAIRRYFRLEIPILFSVLVSYILLRCDLYFNVYAANTFTKSTFWLNHLWYINPGIWTALKEGLLSSLFLGGTLPYNSVLWTMVIEFNGSMLVFSALALFGAFPKRFLVYILLIIILHKDYLPAFIIGLALCDYYHSSKQKRIPKFVNFLLFLLAIYISSYRKIEITSIWTPLNFIDNMDSSYLYILGASLFLFVTLNSYWLKRFFSTSALQFLGKISFSLYLIHLLLLGSLACFLFSWLMNFNLGYHLCFLITFIASLSVTIMVSYLMYRYIDRPGIKFSKWIYQKFFTAKEASIAENNK